MGPTCQVSNQELSHHLLALGVTDDFIGMAVNSQM